MDSEEASVSRFICKYISNTSNHNIYIYNQKNDFERRPLVLYYLITIIHFLPYKLRFTSYISTHNSKISRIRA